MDHRIVAKIRTIIQKRLHVSHAAIRPGVHFVDDLGADFLALVELTLALEEAFDIEIPDADACEMLTVEDAINQVVARSRSAARHRVLRTG
jgi:acyl carrier protein